ncbi:hypothetical protein ACNKHO_19020 [Shigella flexneri]
MSAYIWDNPPAIPLSTEEMDSVFALPYERIRIRHMATPASGVRDDPFLDQHHARLFRRVSFLFYHRARRARTSEPIRKLIVNKESKPFAGCDRLYRDYLQSWQPQRPTCCAAL